MILLRDAAGSWGDAGHTGLCPGWESPRVYRCLLFIKAITIRPAETNSVSFALFQKFLLSLNHDLHFFSLSTVLLMVTRQTMPRNEELYPEGKAAIKRRNCPQDRSISVNGEGDAK